MQNGIRHNLGLSVPDLFFMTMFFQIFGFKDMLKRLFFEYFLIILR